MAYGKLQIGVYRSTFANPINGALVSIFNSNGDEIGQVTTDISGQSETIDLEAPELVYSYEPNAPRPYLDYDIATNFSGLSPAKI